MDNMIEEQPILQSYKYHENNYLKILRYFKLLYLIFIEWIIGIGLNKNKVNFRSDIKLFMYFFLMINTLYLTLNFVKLFRKKINNKIYLIILIWNFSSLLSCLICFLEPIKQGFLYYSYATIMIINCFFIFILIIFSFFKNNLIKYKIFLILYDDFININLYNFKTIINILNNSSCVICFDEFKKDEELRILNCGHYYHIHCINEWIEKNPSCPICRKQLLD